MIIHHWDCDGICSAALLRQITDGELFVPQNFFLGGDEKRYIGEREPATIYLADIALPPRDIAFLKTMGDLVIFDHHRREEREEDFYIDEEAPSTAFIIKDHYNIANDLLPVLGAVGDKGEGILKTAHAPVVRKVSKEYGVGFEQLVKITKLLDSNYILNDFDAVKKSVALVFRNRENPKALLTDKDLNNNLGVIERAIRDNLNHVVEGDLVLCEITTDYRIISAVTRRLFAQYPEKTVIVTHRERGNIYVRSPKDLSPLIDHAKKRYCAGGKKDVCGIILPEKEIDGYIEIIKEIVEVS